MLYIRTISFAARVLETFLKWHVAGKVVNSMIRSCYLLLVVCIIFICFTIYSSIYNAIFHTILHKTLKFAIRLKLVLLHI